MLVVDSLERIASRTRYADDCGGQIREGQADNPIETAAFHLCDGGWSAETDCNAEVVDFVLEG